MGQEWQEQWKAAGFHIEDQSTHDYDGRIERLIINNQPVIRLIPRHGEARYFPDKQSLESWLLSKK